MPLILRTYWSADAWISSAVAGGSKLCRVRMLRHMLPACQAGVRFGHDVRATPKSSVAERHRRRRFGQGLGGRLASTSGCSASRCRSVASASWSVISCGPNTTRSTPSAAYFSTMSARGGFIAKIVIGTLAWSRPASSTSLRNCSIAALTLIRPSGACISTSIGHHSSASLAAIGRPRSPAMPSAIGIAPFAGFGIHPRLVDPVELAVERRRVVGPQGAQRRDALLERPVAAAERQVRAGGSPAPRRSIRRRCPSRTARR